MPSKKYQQFALSMVSKGCLLALSAVPLSAVAADKAKMIAEEEVEVITVSGVRGSLRQSMNDKRFSSEIKDSISAEDIGQLPDENIAEALQRVTGIQMARSADGEGSTVQIRGISDNNVEINGQITTGSDANRSVNFQDLPSELFSGIEVLKAPTADKIEGSLGGTVNLKTRRPLAIQKDQLATITAKTKYNEQSGQIDPDINAFVVKNFRDTAIGDFGFIINAGRKNMTTQTDVFGGGDYNDAPGSWLRRDGTFTGAGNSNNNPYKNDGNDYNYDMNMDVNGDGVADENDVYYIPNGLRAYSRYSEIERDSLNATLQWQPSDNTNFYLDYTITRGEEFLTGSQLAIAGNTGRSGVVGDGNWSASDLGNGSYILDQALIGGASMRMGGAPSNKETWRESNKITLGGDIQLSDNLNVAAAYSTTSGKSWTKQAQLNMGYDWNTDGQMNNFDWDGMYGYDYSGGNIPNGIMFDKPVNGQSLVPIDITNPNDERLSYFQMQRNADDAKNQDDAFTLDVTYELDGDFFTQVKAGTRYATRAFERRSYINTNQKWDKMVDGKYLTRNIQKYKLDPDANNNPANAQVASDLQQCLGMSEPIDLGGSNFPNSWLTTTCGNDFFTDYFGMHDIRAINPETGYGYYETVGSRYDVEENTLALYLRADFYTDVGNMPLFGNLGVRYVETDTESSGYVTNVSEGTNTWGTYYADYEDFLPTININLGLNDEMVLRFAANKAISRPALAHISPSVRLSYSDQIAPDPETGREYAGNATRGNPDLEPIRAINVDLSYEWYYTNDSMFSAALFYKDLDTTIGTPAESHDFQVGEEWFKARGPQNLPGTKIQGLELGLQHAFSDLPGIFKHTGLGANYTYSDEDSNLYDQEGEQIGRRGLSEHSYNLVGYYDDGDLSIRLAYNWRSEFTKRENVQLGWGSNHVLPEIEAARGQLDLTANYTFNKHLKMNFSVVNLNDSKTERYLKYDELVNYLAQPGRRVNLGMVYRF